MVQKHIVSKNLTGGIIINKNILADIADLVRLSPTSCRILLLLLAHADSNNSVITDVNTISKLLGVDKKLTEYSIKNLINNGYIEMKEVKLNHSKDIIGVSHDKRLYYKSHKKVWKVISDKFVTTYKLTGTYNRFYINDNIAKCSSSRPNSVLKHIKSNLFYDSSILNSEIIWEM